MIEFSHEYWMERALQLASEAGDRGDVPVGAIVVLEDKVIGRGQNRRRSSGDPVAHAEIEALRAAAQVIGNWRVEGTLYVTQEPCPMCAGAVVNARVKTLVYGCGNPKAGAVDSLYEIPKDARLNHRAEIIAGVLAPECAEMLTSFFRSIRENSEKF